MHYFVGDRDWQGCDWSACEPSSVPLRQPDESKTKKRDMFGGTHPLCKNNAFIDMRNKSKDLCGCSQ